MLLCRCDSDHAEFITSVVDPRDHPYVLGATDFQAGSFIEALEAGYEAGKDYRAIKADWKSKAKLKTFDEAVEAMASADEYKAYLTEVHDKTLSLQKRRQIAKQALGGKEVGFDWELPRLPSGQYMWRWSTSQVIDRAILAAPLGDVTWSRQDKPNKKDMHDFHAGVRKVFPDRLFAFGYTGAYDFEKAGYSQQEVESFPSDIAKMGCCWQVQPIWATQGLSLHAKQFAESFKKDGIAGYMRDVAAPAAAGMATDKFGKPTARGDYLADAFFDVVAGLEITDVVK